MPRFTSRMTTATLYDGTGTPVELVIPACEGDFSVDGLVHDNIEEVAKFTRGVYDGAVPGTDKEQTWSLTLGMQNADITHASTSKIMDFILKQASYSANITTDDGALVYRVGLKLDMNDGAGNTATITVPNSRVEMATSEAAEGWTIALSGKNNGTIVLS